MDQLGLEFESEGWGAVDEEEEELTLRSLFHSTESESLAGGWSATYGGKVLAQDALLFLIDFRSSMATGVDKDGVPLLSAALRCAVEVMKDKIIARERDVIGVLGFGTEKTNNPNSFANISVIRDIASPDATGIVYLEKLAKDASFVRDEFGHRKTDEVFPFHHALWTCRTLFAQAKGAAAGRSRRRVIVITDDDDPSNGSEGQRTQSAVQAKDLADSGAFVELLCLANAKKDDRFDVDRFFRDVVLQDEAELGGHAMTVHASRFTDVRRHLRIKEHQQKLATTCTVRIGTSVVPLTGYIVRKKVTRSSTVQLEAKTNEPTRTITSIWCAETAKTLHRRNLGFGYPFLDETALFSQQDLQLIRKPLVRTELVVIGFIPEERVRMDLNLSPPLLYHPFPIVGRSSGKDKEFEIRPEHKIFAAISKEMKHKKLGAVVVGSLRTRSQPVRFGIFILKEEEARDDGLQTKAPGWLLVWLPYADDIREDFVTQLNRTHAVMESNKDEVEQNAYPCATEAQKEAAKEITEKLFRSSFEPDTFSNPDIQQYYSGLQTLALGLDDVAQVEDTLQPDDERLMQRSSAEIDHFLEVLDAADGFGVADSGKSRKTVEQIEAATVRKRQADEMRENAKLLLEESDIDFEQKAIDEELDELSVTVLRRYCLAYGLTRSGVKQDIIERITSHVKRKRDGVQ